MIFKHSVLFAFIALACVFAAGASAQAVATDTQEGGSRDSAVQAHRKAEHERIRHEREAIKTKRDKDEAACYRRFAVEDCLRGVRADVRTAEGRLRTQEIELNDAERREKAAARRQSIEEKEGAVVPARPSAADATLRKPQQDPDSVKSQRDQEAGQRAQQQRIRVQQEAQERAQRSAGSAEHAAQARARHEQALKAAQERRARVEKSQAEAAARGRKPAAPLPPASSAS